MHCRSCRRLRRRYVSKDRFRSLRQLLQVCGARHQSCGTQLVGERAGTLDRDLSFVRPHSRMNSLPQGYVNSLQGLGQTQVCCRIAVLQRCFAGHSPRGSEFIRERAGTLDRDLSFVRPHSRMNSLPQGYVNSLQGPGQTQGCCRIVVLRRCCAGHQPRGSEFIHRKSTRMK
jgi:hypothetical protein